MSNFQDYYQTMLDGTIKQINPFVGTEVWTVPGRGNKPTSLHKKDIPDQIIPKSLFDEDYCNFCNKNKWNLPPEKERIIFENGVYKSLCITTFDEIEQNFPYFRRVPNMYEIVTYNYWKLNYNYKMPDFLLHRKENYLSTNMGRDHVLHIVNTKLSSANIDPDTISDEEKLDILSSPLFAGTHELIIGGRHYKQDAQNDFDLVSSGELSSDEHFEYIHMTIRAIDDISKKNRFVRYISIYQNWLPPAGASIYHLHKQLVGLDEWGLNIEKKVEQATKNNNIYNEYGANLALYNDLIIAENEYSLAFADIGHRYPSIAIYSKSIEPFPTRQSYIEIRDMSNLLYACHKAMGNNLSCNEEWYYTPFDTIHIFPWHILLKWRVNIAAGFEGVTEIYINPISPSQIKEHMTKKLNDLREQGVIDKNIKIGQECNTSQNPLLYYRYKK